jgi:pilus assembly protein CpaB
MNWNRLLIGVLIAALVGAMASYYVYHQVTAAAQVKPMSTIQIVVATERLPLGTRLESHHLRTIDWPAKQALPGTFTRVEDCVGRALMISLVENEPVLQDKLAPLAAGAGLPATIPEGMRGMSIAVNDVIGVAGFVQPGTMVDVLVTGSAGGNTMMNVITRTILENVPVLAAGQKIEQDKDGKPQTVPVVTLLVTPQDANKLAMASASGHIQLALRNTIDTKKVDPPSMNQTALFGGAAPLPVQMPRRSKIALPPPPPPAPFVVEVIRGGKTESTSFAPAKQ